MKKFLQLQKKTDWTISKSNAQYCVRGDFKNILCPETFSTYSPLAQWATVRLMLVVQCSIGFQSQNIDLTNYFYHMDITRWEPALIEIPRDLMSYRCRIIPTFIAF